MTNLTNKELTVLKAFETYANLENTISDLGVSWTDVKMLAEETGLEVNTVKGVVGSLVVKGLVDSDDDGPTPALCLTEKGAHAYFNNGEAEVVTIEIAPRPKCAEIREAAKGWTATRKEFIAHMVALGANPATASTQWQLGRK